MGGRGFLLLGGGRRFVRGLRRGGGDGVLWFFVVVVWEMWRGGERGGTGFGSCAEWKGGDESAWGGEWELGIRGRA